MFDDPEIDKLIIYALVGMVAVLGLAVIILGVKRNTYYVDNRGDEIRPVTKKQAYQSYAAQPQRRAEEKTVNASTIDPAQEEGHTRQVPVSVKPGRISGVEVSVTVDGQTQNTVVRKFPCLIGRESSSCDLVVSEPAVSRRHARFFIENGVLCIEDVSEHNGTYINGEKIPPLGRSTVHEGDIINLGRAEIVIDRFLY